MVKATECAIKIFEVLKLPTQEKFGCKYGASGLKSPLLNGVMDCQLSENHVDLAVDQVVDHFKKLNLPHSWWVEKGKEPKNLKARLEKEGLTCLGTFSGLSVNPFKAIAPKIHPEFEVEVLHDTSELKTWGEVVCEAFEIPKEIASDYCKLFLNSPGTFTLLAGKFRGKMVAAGSILFEKEGCYFYNLATLPAYRRQRFGSILHYERLKLAKEKGCKLAVLQCSPIARSVNLRLGYKEDFQFNLYL